MWPLSVFLFLAVAAAAPPQQKPLDVFQDFRHLKLPVMQHRQFNNAPARRLLDQSQRNTASPCAAISFAARMAKLPCLPA